MYYTSRNSRAGAAGLLLALSCVCACLHLAASTSTIAWTGHAANETFQHSDHTATYSPTTDSIWIIGGVSQVGVAVGQSTLAPRVAELDVSDPAAVTVEPIVGELIDTAVLPLRTGHVAALDPADSSRILVWGGYTGLAYLSDMAAFDVTSGVWSSVPQSGGQVPVGRAYTSLTRVCIPDSVDAAPNLVPYTVNTLTGEDSGAGCGTGRSPVLVMFGGRTSGSTVTDDLAAMRGNDTAAGTWMDGSTALAGPAPVARSHHATSVVRVSHGASGVVDLECVLIFGGLAGVGAGATILGDLWELCPEVPPATGSPYGWSGKWVWREITDATGDAPVARYGASATTLGSNQFFMFGGQNDGFPAFIQTAHIYDHTTNAWKELTPDTPPSRRASTTSTASYDTSDGSARVFIIAGSDLYSTLSEVVVGRHTVDLCSGGSASADGTSASCAQCDAGSYSVEGSYACVPCAAGSYTTTTGQSSCALCGAGRYSTTVGSDSSSNCVLCSSGTHVTTQGSDESSDCQACAAGRYSASDRQSCLACPAGERSSAGAGSCVPCSAGTASPGGLETCAPCDPGWHQPDGGQSECFRCPAGLWSDSNALSCEACPVGTYQPTPGGGAGVASCLDCQGGTYASRQGTVLCEDCPAGRAHNQARASSLSVCEPCNPGFHAATAGLSTCSPCAAGTFANSTGTSECFACPKGTYSTSEAATSAATCQSCPFGLSTASTGTASADLCLSCDPGSYRDNTTQTCLPCPPGTTSSASSLIHSIEACQLCDPGTYAPSFTSPSCSTCAAGTVAYTGWAYCTPCDYQGSCMVGPDGSQCSGHGTCAYGHCECDAGWSGGDCASGTCAACSGVARFRDAQLTGQEGDVVSITVDRTLGTTGTLVVGLELNTDDSLNTASNPDVSGVLPLAVSFSDGETSTVVALTLTDDGVTGEACEVMVLSIFNEGEDAPQMLYLYIEDINVTPYTRNQVTGSQPITPQSLDIVIGDGSYTLTVDVAVPTSPTTALDMMFIEDLSGSFGDDLARLQTLLANLIASVQVLNADTYFGVGSFVDTPVAPFGRSNEWSYRTDQPLTPNSADVQNIIDNLELRNGRDYFESQFFALLMVARREAEVGWRAGSRRIAVLATDAPSHEAPEGHSFLTVNNGDGVFDGGDGSEAPPSRQQVIDALIEGMVVPVFLATAGTAHSFYTTFVAELGFGAVVELDSDSSNVVSAVLAGLDEIHAATQLFATTGSSRVDSITPSSYTDVAGTTVQFSVVFNGCSSCSRDHVEPVTLVSPLYGTVDTTLTQAVDACSLPAITPTPKTVAWGGFVQRDRAGPGVSLESLADHYAGLPEPEQGTAAWWSGTGDVRLQAIADAGDVPTDEPVDTALHMVVSSGSASAEQRFTVGYTNVLPVALRAYSKAAGVTGSSASGDYSVAVSLEFADGTTTPDAIVLDFSAGTHDWEFQYGLFLPRKPIVAATVSARLQNGAQGEVWFAGIGFIVEPTSACSCEDGFYASLSSSAGVGSSISPSSIVSATRCTRCPLAFACSGSSVRPCLTGTFSYGGYSSCSDCLPGRTCINGTIAPCALGFYLSSNNTCSICPVGSACNGGLRERCPPGFYTSLEGSRFCLPCLPSTASNTSEASSCFVCGAGTTSNFGRTACVPCEYGESSASGEFPCSSCPKGKYAASRGSTTCEDCPIGTYAEFEGMRSCSSCPAHHVTLAVGATNSTFCVPTPAEL